MAGTTYDMTKKVEVIGEQKPGTFPVLIRIDFSKLPVAAAGDNWKVLAIKDGWILKCGYTRMSTDSTSTGTIDIGTQEDGVELDAAFDVDAGSQSDWTVMDTLVEGTPIIVTADGYIWLDFNTAVIEDGVFEILLEIFCAPGSDHDGI